ncbi:MAG: hypothetical protein EOP51_10950 [Sphingobacteriales bacterium]|nr:MAG: hypothetical protein EOP51_10950 [Sphingobacteriales bacterium]
MKKLMIPAFTIAVATLGFTACNNAESESTTTDSTAMTTTTMETAPAASQYIDLNTGQPIEMKKNEENGKMVAMATGEPVEFYVDMNTRDTFYGKTGTVVNNVMVKGEDMKYKLDDAKVKWDGNELKILYADGSKVKADENEYKYKSGDGKTKVKIDGDEKKIKTEDKKIKIEDGEPTKVKNR